MNSQFEAAHKSWLDAHLSRRQGERRRRLEQGHAHAEKEMLRLVWWPAFGHLEHLHPEYEVIDFLEGRRFIDFAYIRSGVRIAVEVDGYGPHVRDISRRQFCDQWVRQMHLVNDGWMIVRIGYDDLKERPRLWQQLLLQMVGRLFGDAERQTDQADREEREVIRLALRLGRPLRINDVETVLNCRYRQARKVMSRLQDKQWFVPAAEGTVRIHFWQLNTSRAPLPF